jgi:magnesium transporter
MQMVTRHTRGKITWVDLESPSHEELSNVMREFNIDERIEEEIIAPTPYPLVLAFPKYRYLILHFPTTEAAGGTRTQEVDFIVGKNFIITARYEIIETLHNLHRVFEAEELLGLPHAAERMDDLLERLMRRMYGAIREEMEHAARTLDRIESDMFSGKERATVHAISDIGRVLLRFQTTLARHEEPLGVFLSGLATPAFLGTRFTEHAAHIEGERDHVADLVRSYRAAASELRATNDSLLNASQNEIMKLLTMVAFIVTPFTVVATLFGMNVETPLEGNPNQFLIILILGATGSLVCYLFFRFKKWL